MEINKTNFFRSREFLYLVLIFILVAGFRLYFSFSDSNFATGGAYTEIRNIDSVLESFKPLTYDELSYSGKENAGQPLFYYLMAFFSFGSIFMLKLIPEILFALISVLVFFIVKEMTGNLESAFFSGLISGFIPIFLNETFNRISSLSLVLLLFLFLFYSALKLEDKEWNLAFVIASFLLAFTSAWSLLFIISLWAYLFLLGGGFLSATKIKKEGILFVSFLVLLINLIFYKDALFNYGFGLIWQNMPMNIIADNYRSLGIWDIVIDIGPLVLVLGGIGLYSGINKKKAKSVYLFSGFMLATLLLLAFKLIGIDIGLVFLGIGLSIFTGLGITELIEFFNKTKISFISNAFFIIMLVLILGFAIYPSYTLVKQNKIPQDFINDMQWIHVNLPVESVVLGNIYEGEFISGIAGMKNVADTHFVLAPKPQERLNDISFVYSTWSEAKALEIIKKYKIKAVYFSDQTKALFNVKQLKYTEDLTCFEQKGNFYIIKC